MKSKFKSYSFWMSLTGAVILMINTLGESFGFSVNETAVNAIVNSVCGVLVVLGIIIMPKKDATTEELKPEEKEIDNLTTDNDNKENKE